MSTLRVFEDGPLPGRVNMQRDEELLAEHRPGDRPILRFYRWAPPAVSYGYFQTASDFDRVALARDGCDLVRRPTGGRAILHADELTYAVVGSSPSDLFGSTLHETYMTINRALVMFLARLGIPADVSAGESRESMRSLVCFQSAGQHEISVNGKKLIGSAQRRTRDVFLQHGSILTGPGHAGLAIYLKEELSRESKREELLGATTHLGSLLERDIGDTDFSTFARLLTDAFCESLGLGADRLR
jgi:lipoate-protein ligase A